MDGSTVNHISFAYIIKEEGRAECFEAAARFLLTYGAPVTIYNKARRHLYLEGFFYWTNVDRVEDAAIINRCDAEDYEIIIRERPKVQDTLKVS